MNEKPSRIRFGLRTLFELIAVVAFILTLLYYRTTAIQKTGRYEFHALDRGGYLVDTANEPSLDA